MEINSCRECPFTVRVYEQGYSDIECSKLKPYSSIADKGFRKDCPFLKGNENRG